SAEGVLRIKPDDTVVAFPFHTGAELLEHCARTGRPISQIMLANETSWRGEAEIRAGLLNIWGALQPCVNNGLERGGAPQGGLKGRRRAPELFRRLRDEPADTDPLRVIDWVNLFALAVNEENAAGGRVVTAPTNGAAGIMPAVLHYYARFIPDA